MKKRIAALIVVLGLLAGSAALGEYRISRDNQDNFGKLLVHLMHAYETPSADDDAKIDATLTAIGKVSVSDYELANAIAGHWRAVYLDPSYQLRLYHGEERAVELEDSAIQDGPTHAFVVLGFELKDGKMTDELKGRCDAAAAAARSYPNAIILCSGGATGKNNPLKFTEAGLMRRYLVEVHGIDDSRIYVDEAAQTTLENAQNTFKMMKAKGVETFTIVTSSYHQRWGQSLYNAMSTLYKLSDGYNPQIVGDYSFSIAPSEHYRHDDRFAARNLTSVLHLPKSVVEAMKKAF